MSDRTWTISELAAEFAITLRTIRFYEDEGLLTPERVGTTRVFRDRDRVRLQLILRGRRLGFTLAEIAHILGLYDETPGERGQLEFLLADIGRRRAVLLEKRRDLGGDVPALDVRGQVPGREVGHDRPEVLVLGTEREGNAHPGSITLPLT